MCSPVALAAAGVGAGAYGAYENAQSTRAQLNYQASVSRYSAAVGELRATDALNVGIEKESRVKTAAGTTAHTQRAIFAAYGLDPGSGSAGNVIADTQYMGSLDAATTRSNAEREAWALRTQAGLDRANADMYESAASRIKPWRSALLSALGGAGQVAPMWYRGGGGIGGGGGSSLGGGDTGGFGGGPSYA